MNLRNVRSAADGVFSAATATKISANPNQTPDMKTYEIANPSDPYTMQAEDFNVAAVTVAILGNGAYGIPGTPILFGWDQWLKEREIDLPKFIDARLTEIIACLESVMIGRESDRTEAEEALAAIVEENRAEWLKKRHDQRRSSMNDIGGKAQQWAKALREKACKIAA